MNRNPAREGMKETIESIVIALVLAFVFRAFVVEAFVIPTGSMAPTLYGAHATIICEDCGVEFAYGLRDPDDTRGSDQVRGDMGAICPNCNHLNRNLQVRDDRGLPEKGDRILVLKWPFDLGGRGLDPARWDVIVFKDPSDGTTNFIKRCAGLPNEVLVILDGDVYTVPTSELSDETQEEFEAQIQEKYLLASDQKSGVLQPISDQAFEELDRKLRIPPKTKEAQSSLWFTVYDHDHPPRELDDRQPRWRPAHGDRSGWNASSPRLTFAPRGHEEDFIILTDKEIRATNAYNVRGGNTPTVSDQRIRFVLTPRDGQGIVRARLHKWGRSFWASIHMSGLVTLSEGRKIPTAADAPMASARLEPFTPGRPVEIQFELVDYRLTIRTNDEAVATSSSDPASPAYYAPDVGVIRRTRREMAAMPPSLYGEGGAFELSHLAVDRDVYYYHDAKTSLMGGLGWAPRLGWASPTSPIMLREGEYFMLGDNTAASKDSRLWDVIGPHLQSRGEDFQLGTVPRDQLIGKAFFVYWPSGHRIEWLPLLDRIGIIPDVGRMRWIR